jgi:hypothetical protein
MNYEKKYFKYKNKYLKLKKNQIAGDGKEILESSHKPIQEPNNVYYMSSHGCDTTELLDVPEGCIYITFALCGNDTYFTKEHRRFLKMFSENSELLKNPIKNIIELQKIFGQNLHIHYPDAIDPNMRKYMNNNFTSFLGWDINNEKISGSYAKISGLYSIGTDMTESFPNTLKIEDENFYKLSNTITKEDINNLYKNSLYPTKRDIIDIFHQYDKSYSDFSSNIDTIFNIDQKTLFHYFPGIHYNFVCRVDCTNGILNPSEDHLIRRQISHMGNLAERYDFDKNTIHYNLSIGNLIKAKELIERGINLDETNDSGKSLLYVCCNKGYLDLAKLLIQKGVKLDKDGYQECLNIGLKNREFYEYMVTSSVADINKSK